MKKFHCIALLSALLLSCAASYAEAPAAAEQDSRTKLERTTHGREMLKRAPDGNQDSARMMRAAIAALRSLIGS